MTHLEAKEDVDQREFDLTIPEGMLGWAWIKCGGYIELNLILKIRNRELSEKEKRSPKRIRKYVLCSFYRQKTQICCLNCQNLPKYPDSWIQELKPPSMIVFSQTLRHRLTRPTPPTRFSRNRVVRRRRQSRTRRRRRWARRSCLTRPRTRGRRWPWAPMSPGWALRPQGGSVPNGRCE